MKSFFRLWETTNKSFNILNKDLIEQLAYQTAEEITRTFQIQSTRGRYAGAHQSQGYIDWINREIGLPTKNMLIANRLHVVAHELGHGIVDVLEIKDPGVLDRVWEKYLDHDTRFIHQDTFSHVHKYQHRQEIEQKEECLVEEMVNRRYLDKPAQVLLRYFDKMLAHEPQLKHIYILKNELSHMNADLHRLLDNYIDNIIYVMSKEGYTFSEAMRELRASPHGDYHDIGEMEDQKILNYIEERARKLSQAPSHG